VEEERVGQRGAEGESSITAPDTAPDNAYQERLAHFIHMLSSDDESDRWKAADALGRIADPAALDALIDTLWDEDEWVRTKAAWALGRIGDMRAYAPLQRLYRMEKEHVKDIIDEALENIRRESRS
jgi:HEAT repeat protein